MREPSHIGHSDEQTQVFTQFMNDPHVEALFYKIEHANSVDYSVSPPVVQEADEFRVKIEDDRVCFELKKHYPTVNSAKEVVDRYASVWELEALLRDPRQEFKLRYSYPKVVDRCPVPGQIVVSALPTRFHFSVSQPTVTVGKPYPQPPSGFNLDPDNNDVVIMTNRLRKYIQGTEGLPTVAYFCLTILEERAGGRKKAAEMYGIVFSDLNDIEGISQNKGGELSARKAAGVGEELTAEDVRFLEKAVSVMIRRASESALYPAKSFDRVRIDDFEL